MEGNDCCLTVPNATGTETGLSFVGPIHSWSRHPAARQGFSSSSSFLVSFLGVCVYEKQPQPIATEWKRNSIYGDDDSGHLTQVRFVPFLFPCNYLLVSFPLIFQMLISYLQYLDYGISLVVVKHTPTLPWSFLSFFLPQQHWEIWVECCLHLHCTLPKRNVVQVASFTTTEALNRQQQQQPSVRVQVYNVGEATDFPSQEEKRLCGAVGLFK